jgi:hypothetical protein
MFKGCSQVLVGSGDRSEATWLIMRAGQRVLHLKQKRGDEVLRCVESTSQTTASVWGKPQNELHSGSDPRASDFVIQACLTTISERSLLYSYEGTPFRYAMGLKGVKTSVKGVKQTSFHAQNSEPRLTRTSETDNFLGRGYREPIYRQ